jgi:hypothetical protein
MTLEWDSDDNNDLNRSSKKIKSKTRACLSFFGGCGKVFKKDQQELKYSYQFSQEFRKIKILSTSEACF